MLQYFPIYPSSTYQLSYYVFIFLYDQGSKQIYSGAALRWRREKPGTTVCIRDAFYNVCVFDAWPLSENGAGNPLGLFDSLSNDELIQVFFISFQ